MVSNTAAVRYEDGVSKVVVFSDDFGTEEPTVVDRRFPAPDSVPADWQDRTGTWAAVSDKELKHMFALGDDPTVTHRDLPAVRL